MSEEKTGQSFGRWLWEWTKSILVALVVWFFLRTFLIEAFRIPSGSMAVPLADVPVPPVLDSGLDHAPPR